MKLFVISKTMGLVKVQVSKERKSVIHARKNSSAFWRNALLRSSFAYLAANLNTLLSAERHNTTKVEVVVAYVRGADDREFCIADKARERGLTFYEIIEQGKLDLRVLRALRNIVLRHKIVLSGPPPHL